MRICMLATCYPRRPDDAAGWFIQALAEQLAARDDTWVELLVPADAGAPPREEHGRLCVRRLRYFWPSCAQKLAYGAGMPANLKTHPVAWLNVPTLLARFGAALHSAARRADVVHAHWGVLGALAVAMRFVHRRPVVITVHGSDLTSGIGAVRGVSHWALRRADAVATPSQDFVERIAALRGGAGGVHFVPHGVELPAWTEREQSGRRLVTVGRLIAGRRHALLLHAVARVREAFPDVTLDIVGDGPERGALAALAQELGISDAVTFSGAVSRGDVAHHLQAADVYVSPTTVETFGLATVEAAAQGLPVVTTDVGFPGTLVESGQGGYVVPPDDGDALAEALLKLLGDDALMATAGRAMHDRVAALALTWPRAAERMAEIYDSVAG
jgi:glycosyltransferase involved in cell wall biosynthesis